MNTRIVHFVGIGGIGMSALAKHLFNQGNIVSGSDQRASEVTNELIDLGITVTIGHSADSIPDNCHLVVYSSAVSGDNVELNCARLSNVPVILREQLLGQIFNSYRTRIAICGTHGKTTTTAMLDYVLRALGLPHTSFIGGMVQDTFNNYQCGGSTVVAEACEYKESFQYLFPTITVALNMEWDHPDYYKNAEHVADAYKRFFANSQGGGRIIACGDDIPRKTLSGCNYLTYGLDECNDYFATDLVCDNGKYSYTLNRGTKAIATVNVGVVGKHNVCNSIAVIAVCAMLGVDEGITAKLISGFRGANRRWSEVQGTGKNVVLDYAHHPTEIKTTIETAYSMNYKRVVVVFQPHTYSRTQAFWRQFVQELSKATVVGVMPVFSAREQPIEGIESRLLVNSINNYTDTLASYLPTESDVVKFIENNATSDDLVLLLGAGDICNVAKLLKKK